MACVALLIAASTAAALPNAVMELSNVGKMSSDASAGFARISASNAVPDDVINDRCVIMTKPVRSNG